MTEVLRAALEEGEQAGSRYALRLPRRLPVGVVGGRQGARSGSSLEFRDHREYEPGDDLRRLDWNAFARSDKLIVKMFHEETTPHLDLVLDGSRSMALDGTRKAEAALGLAAFFAAAAGNAGMSHRIWLAEDGCVPLERRGPRAAEWDVPTFDHRLSLPEAMSRRPPRFKNRSIRVVLSDLLWLGDPMQVVGPCAEGATLCVFVQILAEADLKLPERGNLRVIDSETGEHLDLLVDAAAIERCRQTLERHEALWDEACRRAGAVLTQAIAETWLQNRRLDALLHAEVLQPA